MKTKKRLAVGVLAGGILMVPTAAFAATVYDGADYAYNTGTTKVTVCDGETDGHPAYSDYRGSTNARIRVDSGNGTCASATLSRLDSFNVCEAIPSFPDSCSSRVYI